MSSTARTPAAARARMLSLDGGSFWIRDPRSAVRDARYAIRDPRSAGRDSGAAIRGPGAGCSRPEGRAVSTRRAVASRYRRRKRMIESNKLAARQLVTENLASRSPGSARAGKHMVLESRWACTRPSSLPRALAAAVGLAADRSARAARHPRCAAPDPDCGTVLRHGVTAPICIQRGIQLRAPNNCSPPRNRIHSRAAGLLWDGEAHFARGGIRRSELGAGRFSDVRSNSRSRRRML